MFGHTKHRDRGVSPFPQERRSEMKDFKYYDLKYRRHLTKEKAEAVKSSWDYKGDDECRYSEIQYKKKTDDYTVVLSRRYN